MENKDDQDRTLMPDPKTVSPTSIPTVPVPVPIYMPTPRETESGTNIIKANPSFDDKSDGD